MYDDHYSNLIRQNEKLKTSLNRAESDLYYEKYQHAHDYNQLKVQLMEWQAANQTGGWIDDLRKENIRLRATIDRIKNSF